MFPAVSRRAKIVAPGARLVPEMSHRAGVASLSGSHPDIVELVEQEGEGDGFWHALMRQRAQATPPAHPRAL